LGEGIVTIGSNVYYFLVFMRMAIDIATCMYYTGLDPFTGREVYVARHLRDRKLQRAILQFFKPENYFEVRKALLVAGRQDLIGSGCDCLIPVQPPKEALEARRERVNQQARGEYVHQFPTPEPEKGYRPGRKSAQRRQGKKKGGGQRP
jgi:hypothetical protein